MRVVIAARLRTLSVGDRTPAGRRISQAEIRSRPNFRHSLVLSGLLAAFVGSLAHAVPGDLDPTFAGFGFGGRLILYGTPIFAMAPLPDGRFVIVGPASSAAGHIYISRRLADGTPDPTFGNGGTAGVFFQASEFRPYDVAMQPDGKIVMAGSNVHGTMNAVRLTANGGFDNSFGVLGSATTRVGDAIDLARVVVVQPDGKIVVGGEATVGGDDDFAIVRFLSNGDLDTSFSSDGKLNIGFGGEDHCFDMALQNDGNLVVVGDSYEFLDLDFAIARIRANGTLDTSFDGDGLVTTGFGDHERARSVAVQSDGKIVVAGATGSNGDGRVARYGSNGALDSSFDGDGLLTLPQTDGIIAVGVQPDGKIVVLGNHTSPDGDMKFAFNRLNTNGSLDPTFDGDGDAFIDFEDNDYGHTLVLWPDGRILAAGQGGVGNGALIQLWQDASFDTGGHQAMAFGNADFAAGSDEHSYGMAVQNDGKFVVAGTVTNALGTESDFALGRFTSGGLLDGTFGVHGRVSFSFHNIDIGRAVAIQPDGKIVVAGYTGTGNEQFLIARFNSSGALDNTFGFGGYNVVDFAGGADYGNAVAIAPDGKIVVAGTASNGFFWVFGAARFNPDGTVDTSFDVDGKQLVAFPAASTHEVGAVVVQPDRKIIVGGSVESNYGLVRINENGSVDTGFGTNGFTTTDMGGLDHLGGLTLAPGGWVYAAGTRVVGSNADFALAQYMPNGVLAVCTLPPCTHWMTGKAFADWGGWESAWSIAWRTNGTVVAAGCVGGQLGFVQFRTFNLLGSVRGTTSFPGGVECQSIGEGFTSGTVAVGQVFGDKIVLAGTQNWDGDANFALASFETTVSSVSDNGGEESIDRSRSARLEEAFPNPLVRESVIAFDLTTAQPVRVRLFDVGGRLVRTLADGSFAAGRHRRVWDGTDDHGTRVAAGVYFARLDAGAIHERRAVVVVR
jgi:uncharacterized delta-60 repeat protein